MTSYYIQAITTFSIGMIFTNLVVWSWADSKSSRIAFARPRSQALFIADAVARTNVFVAFAVLIASTIDNSSGPQISEHDFLRDLTIFELDISAATIVYMIFCARWREVSNAPLFIIVFIVAVLTQINTFFGGLSDSQSYIVENLATACGAQWIRSKSSLVKELNWKGG